MEAVHTAKLPTQRDELPFHQEKLQLLACSNPSSIQFNMWVRLQSEARWMETRTKPLSRSPSGGSKHRQDEGARFNSSLNASERSYISLLVMLRRFLGWD